MQIIPTAPFDTLPKEIMLHTLSYLSSRERFHLRKVDTTFKEYIEVECGIYPAPRRKAAPHPLLPSKNYSKFTSRNDLISTLFNCYAYGVISGCTFYAGQCISVLSTIPPLSTMYWLPSITANASFGWAGRNITSWVASIGGIVISSLTAYQCFSMLPSYFLLKGVIAGAHSIAMIFFAFAPPSAESLGMISLRQCLQRAFIPNADQLEGEKKMSISKKSDELSGMATLLTYGVTLVASGNPIIAASIAYPLSALVKAVSMRYFVNVAINSNH